ncbi:hypothetical protein GQ42DRAFT_160635 [Ramicandelaber brevisporus]|nr:hypothetical protein GQ42DRAFT_160635 [Ramicandelaber brevisporus]
MAAVRVLTFAYLAPAVMAMAQDDSTWHGARLVRGRDRGSVLLVVAESAGSWWWWSWSGSNVWWFGGLFWWCCLKCAVLSVVPVLPACPAWAALLEPPG